MNKYLTLLILIAFSMGTIVPVEAVTPEPIACVLPDNLDKNTGSEIAVLVNQLIQKAPRNTHLRFISGGSDPYTIADFIKKTYPNHRMEQQAMKQFSAQLGSYYAKAIQASKQNPYHGALNTPRLLEVLPAMMPSDKSRILFLGSILYTHDARDSFVDAKASEDKLRYRRPSYAHLSGAKRFQSSFAIPEQKPTWKGGVIQWFDPVPPRFSSASDYIAEVSEFYAAYCAKFGVSLAKVCTDKATFVGEVFGKPKSLVRVDSKSRENEIKMLTIADLEEALRVEAAEKARIKDELLAKQEAAERARLEAEAEAKRQAEAEKRHLARVKALQRQKEQIEREAALEQARKKAEYEKRMSRPVELASLTEIFVVDSSASMKPYHDRIGREISQRKAKAGERMALVLFTDYQRKDMNTPIASLFSESSKADDLASAFRNTPLQPCGGTASEALNEGLAVVLETLRVRPKSKAMKISIITDAVPLAVGEHPRNRPGYRELIVKLQKAGHNVTFYRCGDVDASWVPAEVTVQDLK